MKTVVVGADPMVSVTRCKLFRDFLPLWLLVVAWIGTALKSDASLSPVTLTVTPRDIRASTDPCSRPPGIPKGIKDHGRALEIKVRNNTAETVTGVEVQWGIARLLKNFFINKGASFVSIVVGGCKPQVAAHDRQTFTLQPKDTKVVQTKYIEVNSYKDTWAADGIEENAVVGHCVRVLVNGQVVAKNSAGRTQCIEELWDTPPRGGPVPLSKQPTGKTSPAPRKPAKSP